MAHGQLKASRDVNFIFYFIYNIYGTHTGMYGCGSLLRERFISELKLVQKKKKKLFVTKINEERRPEKNKDEICF